jgi:hypothetical protein
VLGLQRAFHAAGARSVVASLWKVDDEATQRLMTLFYTNLWQKKLPRLEALRQAQLALLHGQGGGGPGRGPDLAKVGPITGVTGTARAAPREWAAWVLSGDPGDLSQVRPVAVAPMQPPLAVAPSTEEAGLEPIWLYAGLGGLMVLALVALAGRLFLRKRAIVGR